MPHFAPLACTFPMDEPRLQRWLRELARLVALPAALGPKVRDELRTLALKTPERLRAPGVSLAFGGPVGARERLPHLLGRSLPAVDAALPCEVRAGDADEIEADATGVRVTLSGPPIPAETPPSAAGHAPTPTWIVLPDVDAEGGGDELALRAARAANLLVWLASPDPALEATESRFLKRFTKRFRKRLALEATESRFLKRFVADRGPHALIYVSPDPTCPTHVRDLIGAVILSIEDASALLRRPADASHPRVQIARLDRARNALRRIAERLAYDLSHLDAWRTENATMRQDEASALGERRARFGAVVQEAVARYFDAMRQSGLDWGERVAERVAPAGLKGDNSYGQMLASSLEAASHEALGGALATVSAAARELRLQPPDSSQIRRLQDLLIPRRVFVVLPTPRWRTAVRTVAREATRGAAALAIAVESWLPQGAERPREVLRGVADVATESANAPDPVVEAGRLQVRSAARIAVQSLEARRDEAVAVLLECRPAPGSVRRTTDPDPAREQALRTTIEQLEHLLGD